MTPPSTTATEKAAWLDRVVSWVLGLLPAALGGFVAAALAAALVIPFAKMAREGQSTGWPEGLIYLLCAGFAAWLLKKTERWPEKRVIGE